MAVTRTVIDGGVQGVSSVRLQQLQLDCQAKGMQIIRRACPSASTCVNAPVFSKASTKALLRRDCHVKDTHTSACLPQCLKTCISMSLNRALLEPLRRLKRHANRCVPAAVSQNVHET